MKERIYVCHTYYHVYVALLKELNMDRSFWGQAEFVLSSMSTEFETLKDRLLAAGVAEAVWDFDEKNHDFFPELAPLREDKGNILFNMKNRIRFTREYARLEAPYIPVDFKEYGEIYVFCDSDPVGYYLSQNHIRYHALEDGCNCIKNFDTAHFDNRGSFGLKKFLSDKLNLIFIQNGHNKYCIDMEVNDISVLKYPCKKYVEQSRIALAEALSAEAKDLMFRVFVRDREGLRKKIEEGRKYDKKVLILTEPLCTFDVRERIFRDLCYEYGKDAQVFLKQHPRDSLDYKKLFPEYPQFDATMPMELLNFLPDVHFNLVVSVLTEIKAISFADEAVRLGSDFMDRYEEPSVHRQNEFI